MKRFLLVIITSCITQFSHTYYEGATCKDLQQDWDLFCKGGGGDECQRIKSSLDSCVTKLPAIVVTAEKSPVWMITDIPNNGISGKPSNSMGGSMDIAQPAMANVEAKNQDSKEDQCEQKSPNPIMIANGQKTQQEQDFSTLWEMPLEFIRYYDSFNTGNADFSGTGKWQHNFDYRFVKDTQGQLVRQLPDGSNYFVSSLGSAIFNNNQWVITLPEGDVETYNINGELLTKKNAHGIGWTLSYTNGKLTKVTHTNGKTIQLTWSGNQITKVTDPAGNIYTYSYNNNRLTGVTYPNSTGSRTYHYGENGATTHLLSGISLDGKRYNTYYYNSGKAIQSGRNDGTQNDKLSYGSNFTTVTNPLGAVSKYIYTDNNKNKLSKIERSGVNNCPNSSASTSYDNNGYISSKVDWNGTRTVYERDMYGRVIRETGSLHQGSYNNPNYG